MTEINPRSAANELIASLDPERRARAEDVISGLLAWSVRHRPILAFDNIRLHYPHVGFKTLDGNVIWVARGTSGGDAKIEVLTRIANRLPKNVRRHLVYMLDGVIPDEALEDDRVMQVPVSSLTGEQLIRLKSALDFVVGVMLVSTASEITGVRSTS